MWYSQRKLLKDVPAFAAAMAWIFAAGFGSATRAKESRLVANLANRHYAGYGAPTIHAGTLIAAAKALNRRTQRGAEGRVYIGVGDRLGLFLVPRRTARPYSPL